MEATPYSGNIANCAKFCDVVIYRQESGWKLRGCDLVAQCGRVLYMHAGV